MNDASDVIGIGDDRLLHMRGVAERAYELAGELFHWPETKRREMFVLGFVHDIGYRFAHQQTDHEELGGSILQSSGYRYWREISSHGESESTYWSDELIVLNLADMQTGPNGERLSMDERLRDIGERYGSGSEQYVQAERLKGILETSLREVAGAPPAERAP